MLKRFDDLPLLLCLLVLALSPRGDAQVSDFYFADFTSMGTFTAPTFGTGLARLTASDGTGATELKLLALNGLGVVGGLSDTLCDSQERVDVEFAKPVVDVTYNVITATNSDGDEFLGEAFVEAFRGDVSLGVVAVNGVGSKHINALFGGVPITSFRVTADGDGHRVGVLTHRYATWHDMLQGLEGTHGVPQLSATGALTPGSGSVLSGANMLEHQPVILVLGASAVTLPFKGGVLVPAPDVFLHGVTTSATGGFSIASVFPGGVPSDVSFYLQAWLVDPEAVLGFAASNGLVGTTP